LAGSGVQRRQPEDRLLRPQHRAWMRLESQDQGRRRQPVGFATDGIEERDMATMDAVKIADRNDATGEI
jgi:hypothetical protein